MTIASGPRSAPLLEVSDLAVSFWSRGRSVSALNGVSFSIRRGEILGVLGESGSGKSVTASAIMGLIQRPGSIDAGEIFFHDCDLTKISNQKHRRFCGMNLAMVFQDALAALNPVYPVGWQIAEMFRIHGQADRESAQAHAVALMERVGITDAASRARQYPHQFSGGMRQRVMIAMAIALRPDLIIADEPTTALDVTVQAQIVDLLRTIRDESGSAIMLITHDLGVIAECADRVVVMYAGRIVEDAPIEQIFDAPKHPYTQGLLRSRPRLTSDAINLEPIPGSPPDPTNPPNGCPFHPRCRVALDLCVQEAPPLRALGDGRCACHLATAYSGFGS